MLILCSLVSTNVVGFFIQSKHACAVYTCDYAPMSQTRCASVVNSCTAYPARRGCFIPSISAGCGAISRPAWGGSCIPSTACTWSGSRSGIPVGSRGCPWCCFPAVGGWGGLNCVPVCYLCLLATAAECSVRKSSVRTDVKQYVQ